MRAALDERELAALDGCVRPLSADLEGDDGVRVSVDDQGRDADLLQVAAEVGAAERGDAVERALGRGERRDVGSVLALLLADLRLAADAIANSAATNRGSPPPVWLCCAASARKVLRFSRTVACSSERSGSRRR